MSLNLLSLFDYSGKWSDPFARDPNWNVYQWDIKLDDFMDIHNIDTVETALDLFESVDGLLIAPPCTDFTVACNRLWDMKDQDGRTAAAVALVNQSMKLVNLFTPTDPDYEEPFFWAIENPVGRIGKLIDGIGDPTWFNPWEFAGHLNPTKVTLAELDRIRKKGGIGLTKQEVNEVIKWEAYNKKTGLWGSFNKNLKKKPIEVIRCSAQGSWTQRLGGKSDKTKELRSNTPGGFAEAFYQANKDWTGWREELFLEYYNQQNKVL